MSFAEFLKLVQVLKMLYGREVAEKVFTNNIHKYYNLTNESLNNLMKGV